MEVAISLAKNILSPLGITVAASAIDVGSRFRNNNLNNFNQKN